MFKKILIANRGEIACRIMRTSRRMGIGTVAVYSDADADALHVKSADEAYRLGPAQASESYLNIARVIEACRASGAEAVHPGYGFLSEKPEFVEAVESAGIRFIGPSASAIRAMGLKDAAKELMIGAGVPVVPGYQGDNQDAEFLAGEAEKIGYPVLIKARAGGGGKGMRRVNEAEQFRVALEGAQREGLASFGDGHVLIEKYVQRPRHIEVQVFGDSHGNVVHLFERDCSLQRRHQKVIEEAPAPGMTEAMRNAMGESAVRAAKAVSYSGAGTVEFIVDVSEGLRPDRFYFMEMNTRLQVEHPVTECITGLDLVEWQLRVAAGEALPLRQEELTIDGWAFEARLYAEDVPKGFLPATGRLHYLGMPDNMDGIRIDSGVITGDDISPWYDPMIAKIISCGETRDMALGRMSAALQQVRVAGCVTNASFLSSLCNHERFAKGDVDTGLIDRHLDELVHSHAPDAVATSIAALGAAGLLETVKSNDPWDRLPAWRQWGTAVQFVQLEREGVATEVAIRFTRPDNYTIGFEDQSACITIRESNGQNILFETGDKILQAVVAGRGRTVTVFIEGHTYNFGLMDKLQNADDAGYAEGRIIAPMPGIIKIISVKDGQRVSRGDVLAVMEAMKMEHSLNAPCDGIVCGVNVSEGDQVGDGAVLLTVEGDDAA